VAGCCECGDEPSGSCATELVIYVVLHAVLYSIISKDELLYICAICVSCGLCGWSEAIFPRLLHEARYWLGVELHAAVRQCMQADSFGSRLQKFYIAVEDWVT
jgi:hypothetical protein